MNPKNFTKNIGRLHSKERSFNRIEFLDNSVKKTIFDLEKGAKELYFYKHIPKHQTKMFPKLLKYKTTSRYISYEMELIPFQDMSNLYSHGRLTQKKLELLFKNLDLYWKSAPQKKVSQNQFRKISSRLIVEKMDLRWKLYRKSETFKDLERYFYIKKNILIDKFKNDLQESLNYWIRKQSDELLHISHGDLCFSNLFITDQNKIKFVDPRGGLSQKEFFIPICYDLAKLSQCIYGNYDGILSNKKVVFTNQRLLFKKWIISKKMDIKWVRLIESSLFLSMLPLHLDRPEVHCKMMDSSISAFRSSL